MSTIHPAERLAQAFAACGMRASKPQRNNLAMLCWALAVSPDCHLNNLALVLPLPGQRQSLVQRLRRLLKYSPSWAEGYRPFVHLLFDHWSGVEIPLVMDRTDLEDRLSILTLGLAYGHRVLPLTWQVSSIGATAAGVQIELLDRILPLVPPGRRVSLYGDSEFRSVALMAYCRRHSCHWHLGLKSDLIIERQTGERLPLRQLPVSPTSGPVYCQNVRLTAQHAFGPVNIIARWSRREQWPRFWATDLKADRRAWRRGRKRFWCEPSFRDWKSYGFDLERSQLCHLERIDALLLPMAITTLWLFHLGVMVRTSHRRTLLEVPGRRDYSLFRVGRDFLQLARELHWHIPIGFTVCHPAPA